MALLKLLLIRIVIWEKPTQHGEEMILQYKKKRERENKTWDLLKYKKKKELFFQIHLTDGDTPGHSWFWAFLRQVPPAFSPGESCL